MGKGRITYNSINVDLLRGWSSFQPTEPVKQFVGEADSGKQETYTFFKKDFVDARIDSLLAEDQVKVDKFMAYAYTGQTFSLERDRDLGTYMSFEGDYTDDNKNALNTNDGTAATFARTGATSYAYFLDPSSGYLKQAEEAEPRLPAGQFGTGVLIEGARTNICDESARFDHADWVKTNFAVDDDDTTETLDPTGFNAADLVSVSAASGTANYATSTAISTNDGVFSIWLKSAMQQTVACTLRIRSSSTGTIKSENVTATTTWQRFTAVYESSGSVAGNWEIQLEIDTNGESVYAYGAQLEVGSDVLFSSQFIPTQASEQTRNAESLQYSATNMMNVLKGTISFWFKPEWIYNKHADAVLFQTGASTTIYHSAILVDSSGDIRIQMRRNNTTNLAFNTSVSASGLLTQNTFAHIVFTYDTTIANGGKVYVDGTLRATSSNNAFSPSDIGSNIFIGTDVSGANHAFSVFDDFVTYKDVKDATWVSDTYNIGRALGHRKNRFSSLRLTNPNNSPSWSLGDFYDLSIQAEEVL